MADQRMPDAEILPPEGSLRPFDGPLILVGDERDYRVIIPDPSGNLASVPLREDLHLGWTYEERLGGAILCLFAGHAADAGFAVKCSREGVRELIADLQSIDAQLGELP
jgi:hypothetical protein